MREPGKFYRGQNEDNNRLVKTHAAPLPQPFFRRLCLQSIFLSLEQSQGRREEESLTDRKVTSERDSGQVGQLWDWNKLVHFIKASKMILSHQSFTGFPTLSAVTDLSALSSECWVLGTLRSQLPFLVFRTLHSPFPPHSLVLVPPPLPNLSMLEGPRSRDLGPPSPFCLHSLSK